ncbi:MAG: ROK family protein [Burkholderiaceae bacterium]
MTRRSPAPEPPPGPLADQAALRIGVDLGGTKIEAIALDAHGAPVWRRRVATPQGDYPATVSAVVALVGAAESELGRRGTVGVGIPGALSTLTGRVKNANSVCLIGRPLAEDLVRALRRDVRLANDANCFATSEAVDGAAAGASSVMGVILGTGVGAGLVVAGRPLEGCNAIAGEWGHNPLPPLAQLGDVLDPVRRRMARDETPGPRCYCGRHGCIETWLSGPGFAADHARSPGSAAARADARVRAAAKTRADAEAGPAVKAGPDGQAGPGGNVSPDARAIVAAMRDGDADARAAFERYLDRLARGLASVINVFDPHVIVFGGGLSQIDELYAELPPRLPAYVFSDEIRTRIVRNRHGDASGVRGAAWLWPPPGV